MIYRASEHGFKASNFHFHCDEKKPTLVIIKALNNKEKKEEIFGGYTDIPWVSAYIRRYVEGFGNSFIFALGNNYCFEIMKCTNKYQEVLHDKDSKCCFANDF